MSARGVELVRGLHGVVCHCGAEKGSGHAFCVKCYSRLPRLMQKSLYQRLGCGYVEAYDAAVEFLEAAAAASRAVRGTSASGRMARG